MLAINCNPLAVCPHQSIMTFSPSPAFFKLSAVFFTNSALKLGPEFEPRRMTWQEGFPSVSTTVEVAANGERSQGGGGRAKSAPEERQYGRRRTH